MSSLFLSYRRADCPGTVQSLFERLKKRLPRWTLFYDHKTLLPGEDFPLRLREEVTSARVVLVAIGPRWVDLLKQRSGQSGTDHVREEVRLALQAGQTVIPVLVENAPMPTEGDLAGFPELLPLLRLNGRLVRPDPDFDTDLERLAAYLDELGPGVGPGTVLAGKYKILREVGQGGMGVVYEVHQRQPNRTVAVKMILEGMDTKEVLARFDAEKEALARMDHPNIARVIDSGSSPSGKPYFVMEFVKGEPLTAYCDRKRLPPNDRLRLFRAVCSAVQHAHQKGIIHRDLKPSNVLVEEIDGQAVPKVIDFGLAKALAGRLTTKTLLSEAGRTVGTLLYASPEQAAGRQYDIDTRTDIYSLGVLLYELLAGVPPFTEEELRRVGDEAIRKEIIETEPPKPSTRLSSSNALPKIAADRQLDPGKLTRLVRGELDWIAMRALEKDPKRRYETASQFSDDIERYLNHEPVKAGKPSTLYRLRKFVRRNRGPVIATGLVFLTLAGGLFAVHREQNKTQIALGEKAAALDQRQTALDQAAGERKKAIENASLAAKRFNEKRLALDEMLRTFSDDRLRGQPGSQPIRKLFLERGIEQYRAMLADRAGDPEVSLHTGDALRELGIVAKELGNTEESLAQLSRAVETCRTAVAANPDDVRLLAALGDALYEQAQALFEQGRHADARPFADESVRIFQALSEKMPQEVDYQAKWGRGLVRRASLLPKGQSPDADLARATELLRAAVQAVPENPDYLLFLARAVNNDAPRLTNKSDQVKAYKEAVSLADRAVRLAPGVPLGNALRALLARNVCQTLTGMNKFPEALAYLDGILPAIRQHIAENPAVVDGPVYLVYLLNERARVLEILQRTDDAIKTYQEISQTNEALAQRAPKNDAYPLKSLEATRAIARIHRAEKREAEAIQALDALASRSDEVMRLRPASEALLAELLSLHEDLADMLEGADRQEHARRAYEAAVNLYERHRGGLKNQSEDLAVHYVQCCNRLASIAEKQENLSLAIKVLEEKVLPFHAEFPKTVKLQEHLLGGLQSLSSMYAKSGRHQKALELRRALADRALRLLKGDPSSNWYLYTNVLDSHGEVAELCRKLGDDRGAFAALRKHFGETEPYLSEQDHSALLADTADFNPANLRKLWEAFDKLPRRGKMKRFTVPVDFNGVSHPMYVYVTDSWKSIEDQIKWIETVRGGKFHQEVKDSFRRYYEIAKAEKISFQDLCVYAFENTPTNPEAVKLFEKVDKQRKLVLASPRDAGLRLQLAEDMLALATSVENGDDPSRALLFLDDVATEVERCLTDGSKESARVARIRAGMDFVRAKVLLRQDRVGAAYAGFLKALRVSEGSDVPGTVEMKDLYAELGSVSEMRKENFEAATWYVKAAEAGASAGLRGLTGLIRKDPAIVSVLPAPVQELMKKQPAVGNEQPAERLARLWPQYSTAVDRNAKKEQEAGEKQLAGVSKAKSPLEKELDLLFQDQFTILSLQGKNNDGEQIYCYLRASVRQLKDLDRALKANKGFRITDYGTVIAAGRGKPPERLKREISRAYPNTVATPGTLHMGRSKLILGPWEKLLAAADAEELPDLLWKRATQFAERGETNEVVRCAAKLREIGGGKKKAALYDAACAYCLSAGLVAKGKAEELPEETAAKRGYLASALTCLTEALAAGATDFKEISQDTDLAPVRALPEFKALVPTWEKLMGADPKELPELLAARASYFASEGQVQEVVRCAAKLREIGGKDKNKMALYDAACGYSLSAGLVAKGKAEATPKEMADKKRYQDLAIACLKEAIAAGYSDFPHMARDSDLDPLRDLPEYKALLPKSK